MIVTLILVFIAFLAFGFFVWQAKGRASTSDVLQNLSEHIREVDVQAFRNLIDPEKEKALRTSLPRAEFRRNQRQRLRAAVEYVSCAARNAAILLRLADAERRNPDPATAEAAENLVDSAIRLRLYAIQVIPRFYLRMIFSTTELRYNQPNNQDLPHSHGLIGADHLIEADSPPEQLTSFAVRTSQTICSDARAARPPT
jgi:hypothetical protein